jgi:hypothetical protein
VPTRGTSYLTPGGANSGVWHDIAGTAGRTGQDHRGKCLITMIW